MCELGHGRCGTVKKIKWGNGFAAVKGYLNIDGEDGRYFYDVYEKELKIICDLQDLWGVYVPELVFIKPWPTNPCIGLQLGQPIQEDSIHKWSYEDQKLLQETINAIEKKGYRQTDMRGSNFVRLEQKGKYTIAMIDFESVEPVVES